MYIMSFNHTTALGGVGGLYLSLLVYMLQKRKLWNGEMMTCHWSLPLRDRPKTQSHNPRAAASIPCSVKLLWPDAKFSTHTCVHTCHKCMLSNKGAETRGDRANVAQQGSQNLLPAATQTCRTPGHLWFPSAWRAKTHTRAHLGKACENGVMLSLILQRETQKQKKATGNNLLLNGPVWAPGPQQISSHTFHIPPAPFP